MNYSEMQHKNVLEKAEQEYSGFLKELEKQGFEGAVARAYEILTKQEFLSILRDSNGANLGGLENTDLPLETLYRDWLKKDGDYRSLLEKSIREYSEKAMELGTHTPERNKTAGKRRLSEKSARQDR